MKLSEKIREGRARFPDLPVIVDGSYFAWDENTFELCGACAEGFAVLAIPEFKPVYEEDHNVSLLRKIDDWFPYAAQNEAYCPESECTAGYHDHQLPTLGLVTHLNDDHRWTPERIADWLEKRGL